MVAHLVISPFQYIYYNEIMLPIPSTSLDMLAEAVNLCDQFLMVSFSWFKVQMVEVHIPCTVHTVHCTTNNTCYVHLHEVLHC